MSIFPSITSLYLLLKAVVTNNPWHPLGRVLRSSLGKRTKRAHAVPANGEVLVKDKAKDRIRSSSASLIGIPASFGKHRFRDMVERDLVKKPRLFILLRSPHDAEEGMGNITPRSRTSLELRHCCHVGPSPRAYQGREKAFTPRGSRFGVSHPPSSRRRGAFGIMIRPSNGSCLSGRKSDHIQIPGFAIDIPIDNFPF
jgi:hypothetical protein